MFTPKDDEESGRDWYDGPDVEEPTKPKPPRHRTDEPEYYDEEESPWEHLRQPRRRRFWLWLLAGAVVIALVVAMYTRFFTPYSTGSVQFGYIESITNRGTVFKTYEGVLIPYKELMDTTRVYRRDFIFTARDKAIADRMAEMQLKARPVRVTYDTYKATVPWRGESKIIITAIDSVDPAKILPPEFTPEYYGERRDRADTLEQRVIQVQIDNAEW